MGFFHKRQLLYPAMMQFVPFPIAQLGPSKRA